MKGKTSEEYQAESQLARFYQNDLRQLEQAIELQMRVQDEEGLTKLWEEMAAITQELNELMQPYMMIRQRVGCRYWNASGFMSRTTIW